jgi:thiamine biosynthesis lipoprotein
MGTVFSFAFGGSVGASVLRAVEAELDRIDHVFSTYRADSEVARLGRGELAWAAASAEVHEIAELCAAASTLTSGRFDAYYAGRFDPTGLVKGWAVARASDLLIAAGSTRHLVSGGGDILAVADSAADEPWRIGIADGTRVSATLTAHTLAVATSGNTERPGEIVDPTTGQPAMTLKSVSVVGPDVVIADVLATAIVACREPHPPWLAELADYRVFVTTADQAPIAAR